MGFIYPYTRMRLLCLKLNIHLSAFLIYNFRSSTFTCDDIEENINELIGNSKIALETTNKIEAKCRDMATSLMTVNTLIEGKFLDFEIHFDEGVQASQSSIQKDLNDIKSLLSNANVGQDVNGQEGIVQALKTVLTCKICQRISKKEIAFIQCCGQIIGCCECINRWFEEEDTCPLCRNPEGVNKVIPFRGLDEVIEKIQ